jgi:hypothetical protein
MPSIETWTKLQEWGFQPDLGVLSDIAPGLSFDLGAFRLSASAVLNQRFRPVVLFTGSYHTARMLAPIEFEAPRSVASGEFLAALLAWNIDHSCGRDFSPVVPAPWLHLGRQHVHLLPWVPKPTSPTSEKADAP